MPNKRKQKAAKEANPENFRGPLVKQIYQAFENTVYPSDKVRLAGIDPQKDVFGGKHWKQITDGEAFLGGFTDMFPVRETVWFYLPAYMVEMIEFPSDETADRFIGELLNPTAATMSNFDTLQRYAIADFLKWLVDHPPKDMTQYRWERCQHSVGLWRR